MKCLFGTGLDGCFRGNQEHAELTLAQIIFGNFPMDFPTVELRGKPYVAIKHMNVEKGHKITVTNSYARPMQNLLRFPITDGCPKCFGGALARLVKKAAPGQKRLYCREASEAEKARHAFNGYPNATMSPKKHLGKGSIRVLFQEGAEILGLPEDFKPHSLRSACITRLVNDPSVSMAETMAVARHSSVAASKNYQQIDDVSEGNRLHALKLVESVPEPSKPAASTVLRSASVPKSRSSGSSTSSSPFYKNSVVELDEWGDPLDDGSDVVLSKSDSYASTVPPTQDGIEDLKADIAEVQGMMSPPRKKTKANRVIVNELRNVVLGLKKRLQSRESDILYYRSLEHDNDVRVESLRKEIRELKLELRNLKRENAEYERLYFSSDDHSSRRSRFDF